MCNMCYGKLAHLASIDIEFTVYFFKKAAGTGVLKFSGLTVQL